jgi:hypothetical protein
MGGVDAFGNIGVILDAVPGGNPATAFVGVGTTALIPILPESAR